MGEPTPIDEGTRTMAMDAVDLAALGLEPSGQFPAVKPEDYSDDAERPGPGEARGRQAEEEAHRSVADDRDSRRHAFARGETLGIVAPAGPVKIERLTAGLARLGDAFELARRRLDHRAAPRRASRATSSPTTICAPPS